MQLRHVHLQTSKTRLQRSLRGGMRQRQCRLEWLLRLFSNDRALVRHNYRNNAQTSTPSMLKAARLWQTTAMVDDFRPKRWTNSFRREHKYIFQLIFQSDDGAKHEVRLLFLPKTTINNKRQSTGTNPTYCTWRHPKYHHQNGKDNKNAISSRCFIHSSSQNMPSLPKN